MIVTARRPPGPLSCLTVVMLNRLIALSMRSPVNSQHGVNNGAPLFLGTLLHNQCFFQAPLVIKFEFYAMSNLGYMMKSSMIEYIEQVWQCTVSDLNIKMMILRCDSFIEIIMSGFISPQS